MDSGRVLDAELEALLREAAADPRSALLKQLRAPRHPKLMDDEAPWSAKAYELAIVDRELLRVRRAELAELLNRLALQVLVDGPQTQPRMMHGRAVADDWPRTPERELFAACDAALADGQISDETRPLQRLTVRSESAWSATSIASVSMRVHPSAHARLLAAVEFALSGSPHVALSMLARAQESPLSSRRRASALNNSALAWARLGRWDASVASYDQALEWEPMDGLALCGSVFARTFAADARAVIDAARRAEQPLARQSAAIEAFAATVRLQRRTTQLTVPASIDRTAREARDAVAPHVRQVIDVLL